MYNRRRDEAIDDIYYYGGSELPNSQNVGNETRKLPSSMHEIIQHMFNIVFALRRMAEKDVPIAFPSTDPIVKYDHRYVHSDEEMLHAAPLTSLQDANLAISVCLKLKNYLIQARSLLVDFYPNQLEHPSFKTEMGNKFAYAVERMDQFIEVIEQVHNKILERKGQHITNAVDHEELEKLKNHIIKIGYEKKTTNKTLTELYPSVFVMSSSSPPNNGSERRDEIGMSDSIGDVVRNGISDRLARSLNKTR